MVDFSELIAERTLDFVGREWVFHRISQWLAEEDSRVFLLLGGPGTGKTAIAARLVQASSGDVVIDDCPALTPGYVTCHYFCQARDHSNLNPLRFVESLSLQLANRYDKFVEKLKERDDREIHLTADVKTGDVHAGGEVTVFHIRELCIGKQSPRAAFDEVIRRPLQQMAAEGFTPPILILVDALDEALTFGDSNVATLLGEVADPKNPLPATVRFLLLGRPDDDVKHALGEATLDLIADAPHDARDVYRYANHRLCHLPEAQYTTAVEKITEVGAGNYLYVRYVIDDLLEHPDRLAELDRLELPDDLEAIYREFLKRELAKDLDNWDEDYAPLLGVLAVAQGGGLGFDQLTGILARKRSQVRRILRSCMQYLVGDFPGPFRIYDRSFRDFLLEDKQYEVYPAEANQAIAEFFLDEYGEDWRECEDVYALRYVPTHLVQAVRVLPTKQARRKLTKVLRDLLCDLDFVETKANRLGVETVHIDLQTTLKSCEAEHGPWDLVSALRRVLDRELSLLWPWQDGPWKRYGSPTFFWQQLHNRARGMGLTVLTKRTSARLADIGAAYMRLDWCTRHASPTTSGTSDGHDGAVNALAISGKLALSASDDCTLRVWDLHTGQVMHVLDGHEKPVHSVVVVPDGGCVLSASDDCTLRVWDLHTGQVVHVLDEHEDWINALAVTPTGQLALSASEDYTLLAWNLQTGQVIHRLEEEELVNAVVITGDSRHAISASDDGTCKVWDLATGRMERTYSMGRGAIKALALTSDDRCLVLASEMSLRVWDLLSEEMMWDLSLFGFVDEEGLGAEFWGAVDAEDVLGDEASYVSALTITHDGRYLASALGDYTIRIWNLQTGQLCHTLDGHANWVRAMAVTPNGQRLFSVSNDGTLRLWDPLRIGPELAVASLEAGINSVATASDGVTVLTGDNIGNVYCLRYVEPQTAILPR